MELAALLLRDCTITIELHFSPEYTQKTAAMYLTDLTQQAAGESFHPVCRSQKDNASFAARVLVTTPPAPVITANNNILGQNPQQA